MGKNIQDPPPPNVPGQQNNTNSGCVNKLLHALNRRHRWQNVRKVLPNKRQGSGKHIIDGATSDSAASTSQPPQVQSNRKKNKPTQNENAGTEPGSVSSKAGNESGPVSSRTSKKFKIRSLISDEMSKKRGKHQPRHSSPTRSSPTRSPSKRTNSVKHNEQEKPATKNTCESPSTIKKRKCDICAAMLTVSYLKQKGQANEHAKDQKQPSSKEMLHVSSNNRSNVPYMHKTGLPKSFSFPFPGSTMRRDFEVEELKRKLRDCKDMETTKEKFILPLNQWKDGVFPKPMLTRPASFKSPSSTSQKENKQTTDQSKTLKQKIGRVMKETKESRESRENRENRKKEKRRILMDAVFHKIPYGRRNSKDPKKVSPDKIKSSSTSSGIDRSSGDKGRLKKTASTSETMSKYRRLLSQTSTRDEKNQLSDHKPRLCVARDHSCATIERKKLKRIRSLPSIRPSDFKHPKEFPVKKRMDKNLSMARKLPTTIGAIDENLETASKEKKLDHKDDAIDGNQQRIDEKMDSNVDDENAAMETKLVEKDDPANKSLQIGLSTSDHDEKIDNQKDSSAAAEETELVEDNEAVDENLGVGLDETECEEAKEETKSFDKDENLEESHQENIDNEKESSADNQNAEIVVENDKSFNEILGMFKKVSDEKVKQEHENESGALLIKIPKDKDTDTADSKDEGVEEKLEVGETSLDHQEKERTPFLTPISSEIDGSMQDPVLQSPSIMDLPQSPLIDLSVEDDEYLFSIDDQPSTLHEPSVVDDDIRPANDQPTDMISKQSANDVGMSKSGFLHLDLDSVKGKNEFQFVKEILERSGFLENELLGEWYSSYQPIDPSLFEEVESSFLQKQNLDQGLVFMKDEEAAQKIINDHHLLLFDLINEALLDIHNKTCTFCPNPLTYRSKVRPMPIGCRILEEVWDIINMYLSWKPVLQPSLDDAVSRDLEKGDGWMNLQADAEFVAIELEEMLTDDLLDELVFDDLLM